MFGIGYNPGVTGSLSGVRVADFSRVLAGPYATMVLADLGADVVKVERPGSGDETRAWSPPLAADGQSSYFHSVNRNKQSMVIDLQSPQGQRQARELACASDVVVENFMPGAMAEWGLAYEDLSEVQPGLIYCSITGFGSGPGRDLPGYDLLVQAMGGLMSITGTQPGEPTKAGVAVVDVLTGLHATVGILAALRHRERTGEGQYLEISLLGTLLASLVNQASAFVTGGVEPTILGNAHPSIAPYQVYQAQDRRIVVAVGNDRQFQSLCDVLGLPMLAHDDRFRTNPDRVVHREELTSMIESVLMTRTADEWQSQFRQRGIPGGPINTIPQAFELATALGLDPIASIGSSDDGIPTVASPIRLSRTPVKYRSAPPVLGQGARHE
jgi:crotonobetainyl-CoA:carnitine CoA-transferase CaiB-like acyl-CoA transferase